MILSLGRTGSMPSYADHIVCHFPKGSYDYFISKYAINPSSISEAQPLRTYRSGMSFLFNSLFILPFYVLYFLPKIIKNYQRLYLPYFHLWNFPFILIFRLLNREIIYTVHDGILHMGENSFFLQKYSDLNLKSASKLIYLTQYVKTRVENTLKINKPSLVAPHGLLENDYICMDIPKNGKNLLLMGRISPYKGAELLAETVAEISDEIDQCIIAGKSNYKLQIKETPKLKILNQYLSEKKVGDLLNWADILVLPYLEASQSGVIALGIYAELPMVCTQVGGLKEQLGEDECVWVEPNRKSLKRGILELVQSREKREFLVRRMKEKKKLLQWENIAENIYNFIRQ